MFNVHFFLKYTATTAIYTYYHTLSLHYALPILSDTFEDDTGTVGDVSFAAPTWQAGISYEFMPHQSLWFQAGSGFRAPTTGEMYAPTSTTEITEVATGNTVTVPTNAANPDLEAEIGRAHV